MENSVENVHADIRIKGSHTCNRPSKGEYGVALPPVYDSDSSPLVRNKYHFNKQRGIKIVPVANCRAFSANFCRLPVF